VSTNRNCFVRVISRAHTLWLQAILTTRPLRRLDAAFAFRGMLAEHGLIQESQAMPWRGIRGVDWDSRKKSWRVWLPNTGRSQKLAAQFEPLDQSTAEIGKARLLATAKRKELEHAACRVAGKRDVQKSEVLENDSSVKASRDGEGKDRRKKKRGEEHPKRTRRKWGTNKRRRTRGRVKKNVRKSEVPKRKPGVRRAHEWRAKEWRAKVTEQHQSGVPGVCWDRFRGRWMVQWRHDGKMTCKSILVKDNSPEEIERGIQAAIEFLKEIKEVKEVKEPVRGAGHAAHGSCLGSGSGTTQGALRERSRSRSGPRGQDQPVDDGARRHERPHSKSAERASPAAQ